MTFLPAALTAKARGRAQNLLGQARVGATRRAGARSAPSGAPRSQGSVVSIVLAVYDPPLDALRMQLAAIAGQTSPDWECIVVNDGSPSPRVAPILEAWTALDNRRSLVHRPVNGGIAAATNDGLDRVTGDIVTICDHDDVIHERAVETLIDHFDTHPDDDVVFTDEEMIDEDGNLLYVYCKPDFSPHRLLGHNYLNHLTAIRRQAIGDLRVRSEYEPSQDYDFFLRVIEGVTARGRAVGHIPEILYSWRAVAGSVALNAGEKPGVADAVVKVVRAAVERRRLASEVAPVAVDGLTATSVQHRFPRTDRTWAAIAIDADSKTVDVADRIAQADADTVCLVPTGHDDHESWVRPLLDLVAQPGVAAAGPRIVTPDGMLLSAGRSVAPTLHDPFRGEAATVPGPWDVFLVTRDVSALAPIGLTLDRHAVAAVGGLARDTGLDAAVAELCRRLSDAGGAVLATPTSELVVEPSFVLDTRHDLSVDDDLALVGVRLPAVRDERYAPTGTAPQRGATAPAVAQLRRLIVGGGVRLITTDVFDTIVDRPVATPSDVFISLGRRLVERGLVPEHVTPALFHQARVHAEQTVRRRRSDEARARHDHQRADTHATDIEQLAEVAAPECTLGEIWQAMPASWGIGSHLDELIEAELTNEIEHLRPIEPTIDTLCRAVDDGIIVHLVSDIYLSADQLRSVLRAVGVDERLLHHITTSSDHRLGKAHGLLEHVIDAHHIAPADAVHVGDNPVADVETATLIGATAVAADVLPNDRHVAMPTAAIVRRSRELGSDGGITAAVRAVLLEAGSLGNDPSFQFGAAIAGPAMAGFARWVAVTADRLGASTVHCMLREGATIAGLMHEVAPDGPTSTLLHASRWVDMRAAVVEGTADELLTAVARRATLTPGHIAAAFDLDTADVAAVLDAEEVPHSHLAAACRRIMADDSLRGQILDSSARLRTRLVTYLRATLVVDDGPIVVADVGWGGTIQEGLTRILRSEGITNDVIGLYFALSTPGEERLRAGARMLAYLPTAVDDVTASRHSRVVSHNAEIIERILTPRMGTLIDIAADGTPVCRPDDDDHIPPTLASAQRALQAIARRLAAQPGGVADSFFVDDPAVRSAFAASIADLIESPTIAIAQALGAWPHDDVAGTAHRSISGDGLETVVTYANAHDRAMIDWSETAWVSGVAAQVNPTFRAQLAAVEHGVDSAQLCPAGENGEMSLAAFPIGSQLATLLDQRVPHTSAYGWSVARVSGPIDSLRAIRFQPGTEHALVDVGAFEIRITDAEGVDHRLDIDDLTAEGLQWFDSHPVTAHRLAHRPGGHIVLPIPEVLGSVARRVEITVGFRCWRVEPDDPGLRTPATRVIETQTRRIGRAVGRRLRH